MTDGQVPLGQRFIGFGLLLEAAVWFAINAWSAWQFRSWGNAISYSAQALAWGLLALPVAVGGYALVRGRSSGLFRFALIVTILLNVVLAPLAILIGTLDPGASAVARLVLVGASIVAVVFIAGVVHALRSRPSIAASDRLQGPTPWPAETSHGLP
jgi:hypothetical protein